MKKLAVGIILAGALLLAVPALSQGPALPPGEYDLEGGQYVFNVPALAATDTPVAPTDTPVPPTLTPVSPTETPTGPIEPFPGAPRCLDTNGDGHDDVTDNPYFAWLEVPDTNSWHDLWNEVDGCHYVHEHKNNPHDLDYIFGTQIWEWAGGDISYPWLRPGDGSGKENLMYPAGKHQSYMWFVTDQLKNQCDEVSASNGCVTAIRYQQHSTFSGIGATGRFHSFWVEARICDTNGDNCGIVRTGGWLDFGTLQIGKDPVVWHVPLPGDPEGTPPGGRLHKAISGFGEDGFLNTKTNIWGGRINGFLRIVNTFYGEAWGPIDPNSVGTPLFFCVQPCKFNASLATLAKFDIVSTVGGIESESGYTDRFGSRVEGCGVVSLDCIPYEVIGFVDGKRYDTPKFSVGEMDISPAGEFWIEFPN